MKTAIAFALFGSASALCPDACSGHGACGRSDKCECYNNFQGYNCAQKTCAFSEAWSDDGAHSYAECGNRGKCNRDTGLCECHEGYEGKGCRRLACPDNCNNHGTCETMAEMNSNYAAWDAEKIMHCKCDPGYSGYDCSERICPVGDDPMTVQDLDSNTGAAQSHQVQKITIPAASAGTPATGDFTLKFTDWRNEEWETYPIKLESGVTENPIELEEALEALPNHAIRDCTVTYNLNTDDHEWSVTFEGKGNTGNLPIMVVNSEQCNAQGCHPVIEGLTGAGTAAVTILTAGTNENIMCSGRGDCDTDKGLCECFEGYTGQACEKQTIIL